VQLRVSAFFCLSERSRGISNFFDGEIVRDVSTRARHDKTGPVRQARLQPAEPNAVDKVSAGHAMN
jgi:hypothetical protein